MLDTLHSRYYITIVILITLLTSVSLFVTTKTIKTEIEELQNRHALALVETIYLNIENSYKTFLISKSNEIAHYDQLIRTKLMNYIEIVKLSLSDSDEEEIVERIVHTIESDSNQHFYLVLRPFSSSPVSLQKDEAPNLNIMSLFKEPPPEDKYIGRIEYPLYDLYFRYEPSIDILFCASTSYKSQTSFRLERLMDKIKEELTISFSNIRIGEHGYLYIFNDDYIFEVHPLLVGTSIQDLENPETGNVLAHEIAKASKDPRKPFKYLWNKPNDPSNFTYRKLAYSYYFEPFGWYIAASFYQDDIDSTITSIRSTIIVSSVLLLIFSLVPVYLITLNLTRALRTLKRVADDIVENREIDLKIPEIGTVETKQLGTALNNMMRSIQESNEALIHIQKMETVGALAGGTAHDLNNILAVISGAASTISMLLEESPSQQREQDIKDFIVMIETSNIKAGEIVKKLLSLSRKSKPVKESVDFTELVIETLGFYKTSSVHKSISVEERISPHHLMTECDRNQLEQVILNILINAEHAMTVMRGSKNQWGGVLSLILDETVIDRENNIYDLNRGAYCRVQISDTGIGMDEETKLKVFDPFFTTKKNNEGTGLGLSLVFTIIRMHGGIIDLRSEKGVGSSFTILIPRSL